MAEEVHPHTITSESLKTKSQNNRSFGVGVHIPILLNEVLEYLDLKPGQKIIDATFGTGGHSLAILEKIKPKGKILGIEIDPELFKKAEERFLKIQEVVLVNDSYANLAKIARENDFSGCDGILFDFGFSSWHLQSSGRGFTFLKDEILDMRFSPKLADFVPAREIINFWPPKEIEKILKEYGEERFSKQISKAIVEARKKKPIISTFQLVEAIREAVPVWYQKRKIHFATKTFQALRIAVNHELENIEAGLKQIDRVLKTGGRAAVISFHSLEDRIVKNAFRELKKKGIAEIITKKPVRPTPEEIIQNPRSRSAKLRAMKLIGRKR